MKRSATPLQFLASAATKTAAMSSRSSYRGGRKQWGRGFSDRPYNQGRGQQFVTRNSHFQSVHDSNSVIREAGNGGVDPQQLLRPPRYNPNQQFRQPPPPFVQNQNSQFRRSPQFDQNSQAFRQPQQFRPRLRKPLDYREWEYAKTGPPPHSEKFIILSYNILADYLALNHRSKLYFHIPRYMMDWEWRKRNLLCELNCWSADIMCFQEVDRFQDLAEELKVRGYNGIWKMRTGNAVDGCAIFWRTSRFKLLYEEYVEFNKLGLRDNVAQICVLELTNKNSAADTLDLPTSSGSSGKVVVCNIHVLFNPKRGEIKLGQVRTLLDKAYAVSKLWNAPVVLCGDFNCTPKSPLYNFISEQKLELSGIDRDKVSGQASAEIRPPRHYNSNPNYNPNANIIPDGTNFSKKSNQAPIIADNEVNNYLMDMQKQNNPDRNNEIDSSLLQSTRPLLDASNASHSALQSGKVEIEVCVEKKKSTQQDGIDNCTEGAISVLTDRFYKDLTVSQNECELPIGQMDEVNCKSTSTISSRTEDSHPDDNQKQQSKSACPDQGSFYEHSGVIDYTENKDPSIDNLAQPIEVSPLESIGIDDNADLLAQSQAKITSISPNINCDGEKKLDDASPLEINCQLEGEMVIEDQDAFLSELHNTKFPSQCDFGRIGHSDFAASQNEFASDSMDSEVNSPSNEVLNDLSHDRDSDSITVDRTTYDPALWTPMEVATATGNADCMFLEHPLKLKSTYTEVEDYSGTRDPNGEPLVTSYNRCFLGTVDYIWSSEGLQTVRVLAPIPKLAMQWTPGFPTKKWCSDHIALASELAFTKDATKVQHHKD
ncbi:carbon catabolite repressor protein 4 homolog 6 isoform X2 [Euphorbia lathyris]|uniref:carbon catabolite repressor protein 4 homolog 6 isoform X2 n=1 Tax=Euphorbia lathyris TaxID=212925 RepID=UPI00331353D3